jgi:hypothetical protein
MLTRTKGLVPNVQRICRESCNGRHAGSRLTLRAPRQSSSNSAFATTSSSSSSSTRFPFDGRHRPTPPTRHRRSRAHIHSSAVVCTIPPDDQAATSQTISDPGRPDVPSPLSSSRPVFAVSFLSAPPPTSDSSTVLGWLPATTETDEQKQVGLSDFKENRESQPQYREERGSE